MASSLSLQLSQIAAKSVDSLNLKAQKAAHSKSLIFEPRLAASQTFDSIYILCHEGFEELCLLDGRFIEFQGDIFSQQSQEQDRTEMTAAENAELDSRIELFLGLVGGRLRLNPAIKAVEWLIRRFRVHEHNTSFLLTTFLPYHTLQIFTTLLSILPANVPHEFKFLHPYIRSLTQPPRHTIVHSATVNFHFASTLNEYVLRISNAGQHHSALIGFWAGIMSEAISSMLDKSRSGRQAVQLQNEQNIILKLLPFLNQGLAMKKVPELRIGCYILLSIMASKGGLDDKMLTAMMEAVVQGWTSETIQPGLVCLSVLTQHRQKVEIPNRIARQVAKIPNLPDLLSQLSKERRVDGLAYGLCISLVTRLRKKGAVEGLSTIVQVIEDEVLTDAQVKVVVKSLMLAAHQVDDGTSSHGNVHSHLASRLVHLTQLPGHPGSVVLRTFEDAEMDMDELEMKLHTKIRPPELPKFEDVIMDDSGHSTNDQGPDFPTLMKHLPKRTATEVSFLSHDTSHIYADLCIAFLASTSSAADLESFDATPILRRQSALDDVLYLSFYIRIWCGANPVIARVSALKMAGRCLYNNKDSNVDIQAALPYVIAALSDPAGKVRRAAAAFLVQMGECYSPDIDTKSKSKSVNQWGLNEIYGRGDASHGIKWLSIEVVIRFLREILIPSLEECVLDNKHINSALEKSLNNSHNLTETHKKPDIGRLPQNARISILAFLASHVVYTPITLVKARLLASLNQIRNIAGSTRTKFLLPVLQQWAALSPTEASKRCQEEHVDQAEMNDHATMTVAANDKEGLEYFTRIVQGIVAEDRQDLLKAVFKRLRTFWPSLKGDLRLQMANTLMESSQSSSDPISRRSLASEESTVLLEAVDLSSDVLLGFLAQLPTTAQLADNPPATKIRRTSHGEIARVPLEETQQLSAAIRQVTFVLQLIDSSKPAAHPELLGGLFNTLAELQHYKAHATSELAYLQGLVLNSLIAILKTFKSNPELKLDRSAVRADLLVDCVQKTASPQVQNSALLLIAALADTAPELVLHSVMPIFTFLGSSVLRQNDDYSAYVIDRTIREVIPPLILSLRKTKGNLAVSAAELLLSFVAVYEHVPQHRRRGLYTSLIQTLGPEEFLFAFLAMLVDKYGMTIAIKEFTVEISESFSVEVQLQSAIKYLDFTIDILKPKPTYSTVLLNSNSSSSDPHSVALNELMLLPYLLSQKRLVTQTAKLLDRDDMEAARVRELYSTMLEDLLGFADSVKDNKRLHNACGDVLESLLGLLSVNEFVKSVESLLDRTNEALRRKILRALEARIDKENPSNALAKTVMLGFLPQLTAIIQESTDILYKHTAVACIDKISEKFGKIDPEAVSAAAETIANEHCLGQSDNRLRVMALLCLASLVDILKEGILSVLPVALPKALDYMTASLSIDEEAQKLHSAGYSLFSSLLQHLPYMVTGNYLDRLLFISNKSADTDFDIETDEARLQCLQLAAKQVDAKSLFGALEKSWHHAAVTGPGGLRENLQVLSIAVDKHPKNVITKYSFILAKIFQNVLDLRRHFSITEERAFHPNTMIDREAEFNGIALRIIYKLNDSTFRPIFSGLLEWATSLSSDDDHGKIRRLVSLYGLMEYFFNDLKSIVTSYATFMLDNAVETLKTTNLQDPQSKELWSRVLRTLRRCFEHDEDDFWQSPSHFNAIAPILCAQFNHVSSLPVSQELIPTIVELVSAADSADHHKEINGAILKQMRSESASVRLAAIKCEQALTERLGEEWLGMLPEMLPFISELQEDDDEVVEKETHRWIVKIEGVLGESLDSMLQ